MTEGCLRNDGEIIRRDSEIIRRYSETIQREDSIMGCGHKGSLGPDPLSPVGHHKFPLSLSDGPKEMWKKGGRVFSVLLAVNLALLACTLVSGGAFQEVHVYDYDVFFMLTIVMIITTLWMLFYIFRTSKRQNAIPYKDAHAGPIWLRGKEQKKPCKYSYGIHKRKRDIPERVMYYRTTSRTQNRASVSTKLVFFAGNTISRLETHLWEKGRVYI